MRIVPKKLLGGMALLFSGFAFANGPPPPGVPPPPGLPIDTNVAVLVAAALVLGCYKVYQFKKHKKTPV